MCAVLVNGLSDICPDIVHKAIQGTAPKLLHICNKHLPRQT